MTIVFVHGAGCTGAVWQAQVAAFPGALALTLPGRTTPAHSVSGKPESISQFADAVADELDVRGIENAVICGHSMGGAVALELALRHNPRIRALLMLASGAKLRVAPAVLDSLGTDFPAAVRTLAGFFFASPAPQLIDAAVAMMLDVGKEQTLRDFRACDAFNVADRLSEVTIPTSAMVGDRDVMTPPKFSQLIADRIPGAATRMLPQAGHMLMLERPDETNAAIRAFVNQIGS